MEAEVIIVGGGLSGLCAAKLLSESGVSFILLEARDRFGGRTLTKIDPKVNYVDFGGSYFGPSHRRLIRLAEELGVETYKINESEDILHYNGKRTQFKVSELPRQRNPFVNRDIKHLMDLMDKMGEEIPVDAPWKAPHADEWDTLTFKVFLEKNCWTKSCVKFFNNVVNALITSESYEASLLSFLWYIKLCGGCKNVFSSSDGGQRRKFKGGAQQICNKIAERLRNSVIKNSPVIGIDQSSKNSVLVKTLTGKEYKAKYIVLALPPMMQMKIHFTPELPALRNQLMQRTPMGTVMKAILYYSQTFWRNKGLCGSFWIEGGKEHPICFTFDDSKPDGSHPAIIGFISADKLRGTFLDLSLEERKIILARSLAEATDCEEFLNPIHYEEKNWMEEQYSGGCYLALCPPGYLTRYGRTIREPIDRLFYAGTETAVEWCGYMEGAIEAGERAAREVLYVMGRITRDKIFQPALESTGVVSQSQGVVSSEYSETGPSIAYIIALSAMVLVTFSVLKNPKYLKSGFLSCFNEL
ncbi:amine oxidase [flavin-containing] B isoform X1 [Parasteatoda tepidariorum]|uniref:amine oxidase [flavin-containing] B isoform X1 n=1 Tax=Parasteatoda tepidariorum TaxID=114398 RepID=UPI001C7210A3|nr:amine oxidase [flavin-containing] B isoform X2 [Parasteatoda tepidariorum]